MFKIELNAHYLIFWTQIYNFLAVQVIYTNNASNVVLFFYMLGLSSIFMLIFFLIQHFEIPEYNVMCNVIQQIKKSWPYVFMIRYIHAFTS